MSVLPLDVGDEVHIGVTHELRIGNEKSWVKFEATTSVRTMETPNEAVDRLSAYVNDKVLEICVQTSDTVDTFLAERGTK